MNLAGNLSAEEASIDSNLVEAAFTFKLPSKYAKNHNDRIVYILWLRNETVLDNSAKLDIFGKDDVTLMSRWYYLGNVSSAVEPF